MHPENYGRVEPQYHVSSTTIEEKEILPQDFVSVLHVEHGIVLGKIVKFFLLRYGYLVLVVMEYMM